VHILTTHKHWDHSGANTKLKEIFPHADIRVVGSEIDSTPGATLKLEFSQDEVA
jgi:glyoxylase-like metal-dependent hydrolase (beta-lactamase superfamily II)